jgi:two-component system, NtrC family, response regulator HydG
MRTVLVVDDKEMMRDSVKETLVRAGFEVITAVDGSQGVELAAQRRPDVIVTDMRMPGLTGIELLEKIKTIDDELPVVLMTAFGTIDTAVKAMREGAFDYLTKPFEGDELIITVKRAIEHRRLLRENQVLRASANPIVPNPSVSAVSGDEGEYSSATNADTRVGLSRLIGKSDAMKKLRDQIAAIAASGGTVLVTGESGVGKEVVARAIHEISPRKPGPFLAVNCAALSSTLLESELFGHEKGAFTGADRLRKGRFELSDSGTLLLDEVSEVSPQIQAKLLRVLQERQFERVGSSLSIGIDVRVIATSNRDLPESVSKNEFRQDLYFRLNVLPVNIPALRDRLSDVPELVTHFVRSICQREGRKVIDIDPTAMELLSTYAWPGNVRELQNICERAVVLSAASGTGHITRSLIEPWLSGKAAVPDTFTRVEPKSAATPILHSASSGSSTSNNAPDTRADVPGRLEILNRKLDEIEREAIVQTLGKYNGHRQKTAHALGIGVRTLGLKLKKWKELRLVAETL